MKLAKLTTGYLLQHPSVKDCLKMGLINYSALARRICEENKVDGFNAALVAARRYAARVRNQKTTEKAVSTLLKRSRLKIKNRMAVAIVDRDAGFDQIMKFQKSMRTLQRDLTVLESESAFTCILSSHDLWRLDAAFGRRLIRVTDKLAALSIVFDPKIEQVPGVVTHIYGILSHHGINIMEEMSCWTDLLIVIAEKDLPLAIEVLSF